MAELLGLHRKGVPNKVSQTGEQGEFESFNYCK